MKGNESFKRGSTDELYLGNQLVSISPGFSPVRAQSQKWDLNRRLIQRLAFQRPRLESRLIVPSGLNMYLLTSNVRILYVEQKKGEGIENARICKIRLSSHYNR